MAMSTAPFAIEEGPNQQPVALVHDRRLTMPEVSAQVLLHLKRCAERQLGAHVREAVVTVPASFTDAQRQATKEAGRLAGLEVMRLLNEPTAAALAYGFGRDRHQSIVVFDFGGGTFDVSILRLSGEIFEVLASDGDFFLGGDDLDRALAEVLADECTRVLRIDPRPHPALMMKLVMGAEAIKVHLSEHDAAEGDIDGLDLPGGATGRLAVPRHAAAARAADRGLRAAHDGRDAPGASPPPASTPARITDVICVGGSTRIPLVRERLVDIFGREPNIRLNPDEVVAQGAALQAGNLTGTLSAGTGMGARDAVATPHHSPLSAPLPPAASPAKRPILLDVNPASLSIQSVGGYAERILDKNAPIPIEKTRVFTTARDNQVRVEIDCCRGEARRYAENEPLGTLVLEDLPPRQRGDVQIEVSFRVDADGILHVSATDQASGMRREASLQILGAPVGPSPGATGGRTEPT